MLILDLGIAPFKFKKNVSTLHFHKERNFCLPPKPVRSGFFLTHTSAILVWEEMMLPNP